MSSFPCDLHGRPEKGRLLGFYPTLIQGGARRSSYKRYCVDAVREVISAHRKDWLSRNPVDGVDLPECCTSCGVQFSDEQTIGKFFVTAYVRTDSRVDYQAQYCKDCAEMIVHEFNLKDQSNGLH